MYLEYNVIITLELSSNTKSSAFPDDMAFQSFSLSTERLTQYK